MCASYALVLRSIVHVVDPVVSKQEVSSREVIELTMNSAVEAS